MLKEISILHETLKDCVLSPADKVAIRNEIGDLQDRVALLDFQEPEDIDYGYHAQHDMWYKPLSIRYLRRGGAVSRWYRATYESPVQIPCQPMR